MARLSWSAEPVCRWVDDRREPLVELAAELVRIPSQNPGEYERAVADRLDDVLRTKGLGNPVVRGPQPDRPSVVTRIEGQRPGPVLLMNGHLDTKPSGPRDAWAHDPFGGEIHDGLLYGLGSADMKGALAAMVFAAEAVRASGVGFAGTLMLAFVADEEFGGALGMGWLVDEGLRADAALIGEPSGLARSFDSLCIADRGVFRFKLCFDGTQTHSSLADQPGVINANLKAAAVLCRMAEELQFTFPPHPLFPQGVTQNLGAVIQGGVGSALVPGRCEFLNDVRVLPGMTHDGCRLELEAFLDRLRAEDPDLHVHTSDAPEDVLWRPASQIASDHPLVEAALWAAEAVGGPPAHTAGLPAGTDARFLTPAGIPTIPAFGPGLLSVAHSPQECVPVDDLVRAAKVYAATALEYFKRSAVSGQRSAAEI